MARFCKFLNEKTFRIGKDVDYIFKKYFKKTFDAIKKGKWDGKFKTQSFSSNDLPSQDAKKASKINPITITVTLDDSGSYYIATTSKIQISPNKNALDMFLVHGTDDSMVYNNLKTSYKNEFTGVKIKDSISHELSHWLDDSLHNRHIKKMNIKTKELYDKGSMSKAQRKLKQGHQDVAVTSYEINAQIHSIKQLKRQYLKVWDDLTFKEMVDLDGSLNGVYSGLTSKEFKNWKKLIYKRMNRERLLGKNMGKK